MKLIAFALARLACLGVICTASITMLAAYIGHRDWLLAIASIAYGVFTIGFMTLAFFEAKQYPDQ